MATRAEIESAIAPHAERLADGAVGQLASMWSEQLTTVAPELLPEFVQGRLSDPRFKGFLKPPQETQGPPPEDPTLTHARQFREQQIRGGDLLGTLGITQQERNEIRQQDYTASLAAQAEAAAQPPPPWFDPKLTPTQLNAARVAYEQKTRDQGSLGLRRVNQKDDRLTQTDLRVDRRASRK